ncbi:hypothetical protein IKQ19_06395 [Candidatus Saccharibacteria bacterium]|nr:hypothetical protein [Candidatus Saccharibacteria bacterium]
MAKNDAKESARLRTLRIDGSQNGATLRTRIVRDKTKYTRTLKHKKSLADAGDFPLFAKSFSWRSSSSFYRCRIGLCNC